MRNLKYRSTISILFSLAFIYLVFAPFVSSLFPDDFYLFYKNSSAGKAESIWFGFFYVLTFIFIVLYHPAGQIAMNRILLRSSNIIHILYLLMVAVYGLYIRMGVDMTRPELLDVVSSFFIPGYSFLLYFSISHIVNSYSARQMVFFLLVCILLDSIYMGKIFTLLFIITWMLWIDVHGKDKKYIFHALLLGLFFAAYTFVVRALVADDGTEVGIGLYTFFSEFVGVFATIGWAEYYNNSINSIILFDFNSELESAYRPFISHGLALHPSAYFVGNFGDYYYPAIITYFFIVLICSIVMVYLIGEYYIFVFALNSIHLFRHGPDVFLKNIFSQSLALVIASLLFNFIFRRSSYLSNQASNASELF